MSEPIRISSTFALYVEESQFQTGKPCVQLRLMYDGRGPDDERQAASIRLPHRMVPDLIAALSRMVES